LKKLLPITVSRKIKGGQDQSGQAIKLFQAPRKISIAFHFWHKSFILDDVKLAELSNNSCDWKNVTFSGVGGDGWSKHTLTPPTYFQWVRTSNPMIYPPGHHHLLTDKVTKRDMRNISAQYECFYGAQAIKLLAYCS